MHENTLGFYSFHRYKIRLGLLGPVFLVCGKAVKWVNVVMNRYSYSLLILLLSPVPIKSYDASMVSYRTGKDRQVCTNFAVSEKTVP